MIPALLLYWLPQLLGDGGPGSNALPGPVGALAVWINAHQLLIGLIALGLVVAVAITAVAQRPRGAPTDESANSVEDCCGPHPAESAA